ncbi:hypothetical protein [Pseudomonas antarctica]|uniref:hypothetical protein n=1 Tax=Pseudomonas antarctica TaxID=219572 RepID=UPI003F74BEAF
MKERICTAFGTSIALLVLNENGAATDYLMVRNQDTSQKMIQKSSWTYDAERNLFEQTVNEVSVQNGKSPAEVSHPQEVIRASISLEKSGMRVLASHLKKTMASSLDISKAAAICWM